MAQEQLSVEQRQALKDKWHSVLTDTQIESAQPLKEDELEQRNPNIRDILIHGKLIELLTQRNEQRQKIFRLATWYCWVSLLFLIAIVFVQIAGRVAAPNFNFNIFSGNELQILVVGVFGQFVGLLYIITKSLYDDTNYKDLFVDNIKK